MTDRTDAGRPVARGIAPALAVSAAGHALLLSAALLFGPAASIVPRTWVVELVLVDGGGAAGVPGAGTARPGGPAEIPGDGAARTARERGAGDLPGASVAARPRTAVEPADVPAGNASAPPADANSAPPGAAAAPAVTPVATSAPAAVAASAIVPPVAVSVSPVAHSVRDAGRGARGTGGGDRASAGSGPAPGGLPAAGAGGGAGGWHPDPLREKIQSRIVYPAEAVRRGQEGEVLLRIRVDGRGNPAEIRVTRSSGMRLLDDAALRGVLGSAPLPAIPGWVEVPVRFFLR